MDFALPEHLSGVLAEMDEFIETEIKPHDIAALIPIITIIGLTAALLVSGAVVTENVFNLPGVGNLVVSAVLRRDYPVIQGALLIVAGIYVLINFAIDMLYLLVDPRVKY